MNENTKPKQQLLLETEELRTRLDAREQRFQETHETLQAVAQKYAESIVETVREPLVVLDSSLKVISANRSFYETFQVTPRETEGRSIFEIGNYQWDIPALRKLLEEIIPKNTHFNDFEVDHEFSAIGRKRMLLNARRVYREGQGTDTILLAIEDMTAHREMEEALKISETRYRRLFETAQDGILILDAETGQISDVNPFLVEMLGYSHEDVLGKKLWEIGAFKDIEASKAAFSELQSKGYVRYNDLPLETKDGRSMAVEFVSNVYMVNRHKVIQCNIRDITQRKQIEDVRKFLMYCGLPGSGEDFFKSLARYLAENLEMDYVCINRLQEDGLAAQTVAIYFDGKFEDNLTCALKDTPCGDVLEKTICCFPKGVRHLYPLDVVLQEMMAESYVGTTLWSSKGKPIGLIAIIGRQPLANPQLAESMLKLVAVRAAGELERREAEEALQEKTHELDGRVKELNCLYAFSKFIERPDIALSEIFEELVDIIPPGWQYPEVTCARLVFEDQILKTPNFNETIWKQSSPILVDGRSAGTLEVYYLEEKPECDEGPFLKEERDLIDALAARLGKTIQRKRMEEAILKSEETLLAFFNAGIHQRSILELREDDIVYKLPNQNTAAFFGLTVEEMAGKSLKGLGVREESIRFWLEQFRRCQKTGETTSFEYVFPYKGRKPWFTCSLTPLRLPNEQTPLFRFMALEITDRKHAELLSKALNDINIQINSGLEYDEMMQTVVTEAGRAMGCETAAISLKKDDRWTLSYVYGLSKEWVGTEVGDEEQPLALSALKTKKPVVIEDVYNDERVNRKHVDKYGVRSFLVSPILAGDIPVGVIFFNNQNPTTFNAIQVDFCLKLASSISFAIQNAKLVKEVTYHAKELENANKELESFAYSVSHDLKAPLIVASGFSRRLSEVYGEKLDAKGRHYLQRLQEACQQMNLLIEDLLKLSKMTASRIKFESIDLSDLVKSIATQLKEAQPEREVKFLIEEGLTAKGDSHFLNIGLENLLGNAWKFTGKRKQAKIEFGLAKRFGDEPTYFVRDNGCGFDMSMADRLFKPFQRLHEDGEFSGTGVGLATVHRIITRHGGRIWAESVVGKGTTFFFTLSS